MIALGSLGKSQNPFQRQMALALLGSYQKRRTFFSFHYDDVFRVNSVRNAFKIYNPQISLVPTFQDSSLWESRKLDNPESIKNIIRNGINGTSVVAVLIGKNTWARRWVRYEIARSIIDGKGLLAIHINDINHHMTRRRDWYGENPLSNMGLVRDHNGFVKIIEYANNSWRYYADYMLSVPLPKYVPSLGCGCRISLSDFTIQKRFIADDAHKNIGVWIEAAAKSAQR
jgi:hypothetical protein